MEKEFVPYNQALKLKALGFDEPCFGYYGKGVLSIEIIKSGKIFTNEDSIYFDKDSSCLAPTFGQAFRWFREKYGIYVNSVLGKHFTSFNQVEPQMMVLSYVSYNKTENHYEEAELACLDKLIELTIKSE